MQTRVDLTPFNTLQLPARANHFVQADSREQLLRVISEPSNMDRPLLLLGGGSNVVFTRDVEGLCLRVNSRGVRVERYAQGLAKAYVRVTAEAGEPWHQFVSYCLEQGWYGLENLALIPGTVGAAPIQNIGAYGVEVKESISQVEVWDRAQGELRLLSNAQCQFGYRDSLFKTAAQDRYLIVSVSFDLPTEFTPKLTYGGLAEAVTELNASALEADSNVPLTARQVFDTVVRIRQQKLPDPSRLPNAGSFFKNPVISISAFEQLQQTFPAIVGYPDAGGIKLAAGWLIDQAGWKGVRQGAVGVHAQQALVLVNYGGATGEELLQLADAIQADIQERFGVVLDIEPRII